MCSAGRPLLSPWERVYNPESVSLHHHHPRGRSRYTLKRFTHMHPHAHTPTFVNEWGAPQTEAVACPYAPLGFLASHYLIYPCLPYRALRVHCHQSSATHLSCYPFHYISFWYIFFYKSFVHSFVFSLWFYIYCFFHCSNPNFSPSVSTSVDF